MAYISTETVKTIREQLKKEFPNIKFSITREHYSSIHVNIMKANLDFSNDLEQDNHNNHIQLNHYYLERYEHSDVLKRIYKIVDQFNHNNSDPMTDYVDVGYYVHMNIGKWNKPYTKI